MENQEEQEEYIQSLIKNNVSESIRDGALSFYPFPQSWILDQKFNWEISITPSARRKFDQFALLNTPFENSPSSNQNCFPSYYVHGPKFDEIIQESYLESINWSIDVPMFTKLPNDALIRHTRNQNIKD